MHGIAETMSRSLDSVREKLEGIRLGPIQWLVSISAVLMVRFFLEALSSPTSSGIVASDMPTLVHYYLWFLALALASMVFLWFALPAWRKAIPALMVFVLLATWLAPVADFIWSGGAGLRMAYLFQSAPQLARSFLSFFGSAGAGGGATVGIRIEVALILAVFMITSYFSSSGPSWKKALRTIGSALALYAIIFAFGSLPSLVAAVAGRSDVLPYVQSTVLGSATISNDIHGNLFYGSSRSMLEAGFDFMIGRVLLAVVAVLGSVWLFLRVPEKLVPVLRNSRWERVGYYWAIVGVGAYLAYRIAPPLAFTWNDATAVLALLVSIYAAWLSAVCVNDIHDVRIDAVSNKSRPLVSGSVGAEDMREGAVLFLVLALIAGYLAGYYAFFCVVSYIALSYVYSAPPLRLRRFLFAPHLIIAFATLAAAVAGFFTISQSKLVSAFPVSAIGAIVLVSFLAAQVKDLKDAEGDASAGISTIPTCFGPVWGPRIVGAMAVAAYFAAALFMRSTVLLILAIIPAAITYYFIVRPRRTDRVIFVIYFISLVSSAVVAG